MANPMDSNDKVQFDDVDIYMASGKQFRVFGDSYVNGVPIPGGTLPPAIAGEFVQVADGNVSALTMVQDLAYYIPFDVARAIAINQILVQVTTLGASSSIRAGIYADSGTLRLPGSLVIDGGSVASDTTGVKTFTAVVTLMPGRYWVLVVAQGGTPAISASFSTPIRVSVPTLTVMGNFVKASSGLSGALPASAPAVTTVAGAMPAVAFRVA